MRYLFSYLISFFMLLPISWAEETTSHLPLKGSPTSVSSYISRGIAYGKLGQYQKAIEDFNKGIELNPKYILAYHLRGATYVKLSQYQQAIKDLTKAIELDPNNADPYNTLGEAYRLSGNYSAAIQNYQRAIQINPSHPSAYYNLGYTYYKENRPYHSVMAYLSGFLNDKNALNALRSLSVIDILTGRF